MKKILIAGEADKTVNYENAVKELGALPVTSLQVPGAVSYDGLILPGGEDIDPLLFGQLLNGTRSCNPELDRLQLAILKAFIQDKKPVLGICKGMQLINICFGGDMVQHLETAAAHEYKGKDQFHTVFSHKGSIMEKLYGESLVVNSAHHQGVELPGKGLVYTQFAQDGVAEALEHRFLPILGVQWHPERLCSSKKVKGAADGGLLLSYFLEKCGSKGGKVRF